VVGIGGVQLQTQHRGLAGASGEQSIPGHRRGSPPRAARAEDEARRGQRLPLRQRDHLAERAGVGEAGLRRGSQAGRAEQPGRRDEPGHRQPVPARPAPAGLHALQRLRLRQGGELAFARGVVPPQQPVVQPARRCGLVEVREAMQHQLVARAGPAVQLLQAGGRPCRVAVHVRHDQQRHRQRHARRLGEGVQQGEHALAAGPACRRHVVQHHAQGAGRASVGLRRQRCRASSVQGRSAVRGCEGSGESGVWPMSAA
jgi:hypothetical protein